MNITISGHHISITDAIDAHVKQKSSKVSNHFQDLMTLDVILTVEKNEHIAEINTHKKGKDLSVKVGTNDMYQSITEAFKKLYTVLQSQKSTKIAARHKNQHQPEELVA